MSLVQNLQGVQQFFSKESAAPTVVGQGGQCGNNLKTAGDAAEIRLDPPQGYYEAGLHSNLTANLL